MEQNAVKINPFHRFPPGSLIRQFVETIHKRYINSAIFMSYHCGALAWRYQQMSPFHLTTSESGALAIVLHPPTRSTLLS